MKLRNYFSKPIKWTATGDPEFPYKAVIESRAASIRFNDFPADELYTLIIDSQELDFSNWPDNWSRSVKKAAKKPIKTTTNNHRRSVVKL